MSFEGSSRDQADDHIVPLLAQALHHGARTIPQVTLQLGGAGNLLGVVDGSDDSLAARLATILLPDSSSGHRRVLVVLVELVHLREERIDLEDGAAESGERHAPEGVQDEDALEDRVRGVRHREHFLERVGIGEEAGEALVLGICQIPGVVAGDHVDEDDAQRPDVAEAGTVGSTVAQRAQTFCRSSSRQQ